MVIIIRLQYTLDLSNYIIIKCPYIKSYNEYKFKIINIINY